MTQHGQGRRWSIAVALGSALGLGCGGTFEVEGQGHSPITVTTPVEAVACGGTASLAITTHDFVLEAPDGQPNQEGHGHYHVYLHGTGDPILAGASATAQVPMAVGLDEGAHELHVVLMNNDHTPVADAAHAVVDVQINKAACVGAAMTSTQVVRGQSAGVVIEVNNFTLEEPASQPNQAGHGHYHILLDGQGTPLAAAFTSNTTINVPAGTPAGEHELHVMLMNNDHTPVADAAHGVLKITVQ